MEHIYKEINRINKRSDEIEEYKGNAGEKEVRSDGNDEGYERRRKGRSIENQQEQKGTKKENFCFGIEKLIRLQ
jgi:hypothetical protein